MWITWPGGRRTRALQTLGMRCCVSTLLLFLVVSSAWAQTNDEVHAGQQFSLAPPGARSMAMGGAFSGLADDATAAFANPAGLLWLRKPEVSIELRSSDYRTRYPDTGSASGLPSLCPEGPSAECTDTTADLRFKESSIGTEGLAFISYVHLFERPDPSGTGGQYREKWRLALFQHRLADYGTRLRSEGPYLGGEGTQRTTRSRLAAVDAVYVLRVETLGASVAREITSNDRVRLWSGLSLGWNTLELNSRMSRYRNIEPSDTNPALTGPADFSLGNETNRQTQSGDDDAISWSAGLILRSADSDWSIGAVYRRSPEFDIDYQFEWGAEARDRAESSGNPDAADPGVEAALSGKSSLRLPETWSIGGSVRLGERLRVSADLTRVQYSQLKPNDNVLLNLLLPASCGDFARDGTPQVPPVPCRTRLGRLDRFVIDDANEIHAGVEYVIGQQPKVALRLGAWLDPDHQLRFEVGDQQGSGDSPIANSMPPLDRLATRFLAGDDEVHVTGGLGLIPSRERLQIDFAVDLSDRSDIVSLSAVYRW